MTKNGWIWENNLLAFLLILSNIGSYTFDQSDWEAIDYGLVGTSDEDDVWFDYKLEGEMPISLRLAKDPEQELVIYNLVFPKELQESMALVEYIVGDFLLTPRYFKTTD